MKTKTLATALCGAALALPASAVVTFVNQSSVTRGFNTFNGEENLVVWTFNLSGFDGQRVDTATLVLQSTTPLAISTNFDVLLRTRPERQFGNQEPSFLFLEVFPTERQNILPGGATQTIEFELSESALAELQMAIDSEFSPSLGPGEAALIAAPELELAIFDSPESFFDAAQLRLELSPVPEPSSALLSLLAVPFLLRRKR